MEDEKLTINAPSLHGDLKKACIIFRQCVMNEYGWSEPTYFRKKRANALTKEQKHYLLNLFESIIFTVMDRNCRNYHDIPVPQVVEHSINITFPLFESLHEILWHLHAIHRNIVMSNFKWSKNKYYRVGLAVSKSKRPPLTDLYATHGSASSLLNNYLKEIVVFRKQNRLSKPKQDTSLNLICVVKHQLQKLIPD